MGRAPSSFRGAPSTAGSSIRTARDRASQPRLTSRSIGRPTGQARAGRATSASASVLTGGSNCPVRRADTRSRCRPPSRMLPGRRSRAGTSSQSPGPPSTRSPGSTGPGQPPPRHARSLAGGARSYGQQGSAPRKRHTQPRQPDGSLYAEELFGVEGFSGRSSLLYHLTPPTRTHKVEPIGEVRLVEADDGTHRHRLTKTGGVAPRRAAVRGRPPPLF